MRAILKISWIIFLVLLSSCIGRSADYCHFYAHLHRPHAKWSSMQEDEYFLIILVEARHLDYSRTDAFFHSVAKHPSDGSKTGDVGHAWIYLQGKCNGKVIAIEGGHSAERDREIPRYFDGIMNYNDWGYANPTDEQKLCPRYEPNPVKYLWTTREDGYFQKGTGGHQPTFAAKVSLSDEQFTDILNFIHPCHYLYRYYALTEQQCSSFVVQVAALAGLSLEAQTSIKIAPNVYFGGRQVRFWENSCYATIHFPTPDVVEKSLMHAVETGQAEYALDWYKAHRAQNYKTERCVTP